MGVLDEAIRQHLELKRRRGADASEIKREEDEALGAVVRARRAGPDQADGDQPEPHAAPSESESAEPAAESIAHQPTEAFDPAEVAAALGQIPDETIGEAAAEPELAPELDSEPDADAAEPDEALQSPATEEPPAEEAAADAEEAQAPDEPAAGDELEETPEFLEDAPEHDKLWFEQKPPKDFDF